MNKEFLTLCKDHLDVTVSAEQHDLFARYADLLHTWNQRLNLTAVREKDAFWTRHFFDSLTCLLGMGDLTGKSVIDVGTGAGFPGIPLAILFPESQITLVESVRKKADFCQEAALQLGLGGIEVVTARIEEVGQHPDYREQYDWATARALAAMPVLVEYLLPLVKVGGGVLAQKGNDPVEETAQAKKAIKVLGGELGQILEAPRKDEGESARNLVLIKKISPTPKEYPRHVGTPSKKPIK
jgi:16S rRNA (guanine527-N7)-methyltransferase